MYTFSVRGPSEGLSRVMEALLIEGKRSDSRNGEVIAFNSPVLIEYCNPVERVLFYQQRDANPFFHLMESLWMLNGRRDVKFVDKYNSRIHEFSDDGKIFHGAYGYRWRNWFKKDQLEIAVQRLRTYPDDRRTVVSMWDGNSDLREDNLINDLPCNTAIYFNLHSDTNKLDMTITNRSNDLIWGTFGANAVHMSVLHEYMAARVGGKIGSYYHFTNNLHAYSHLLEKLKGLPREYDPYLTLGEDGLSYKPPPLVTVQETFDVELDSWMADIQDSKQYLNDYLSETCSFVRSSWAEYKKDNLTKAVELAEKIDDRAWRRACTEWLYRRIHKRSLH